MRCHPNSHQIAIWNCPILAPAKVWKGIMWLLTKNAKINIIAAWATVNRLFGVKIIWTVMNINTPAL